MSSDNKPKVILDDGDLLVINKPSGWLIHADVGRRSLLNWAHERETSGGRDPNNLMLAHRLDKDTSGLVLMARGQEAIAELSKAFSGRQVHKLYVAITWPCPSTRWAKVELNLRAKRIEGGEVMVPVEEANKGTKLAVSEVEVLGRGRRFGFVRVIPEQGRKHHVRVTLAEMAAPIVGDFLYGGRRIAKMAPRIMLHARLLELKHPTTGEHLVLKAPVPPDMRALIEADGGKIPSRLDIRHR
jgi:RluA family pseudouridine synthase